MPKNGNGTNGKKKIIKPKGKIGYDLLKKKTDIVPLAANFYALYAMKIYAEDAMSKNGGRFLKSREKFFETLTDVLNELSDKTEKFLLAYFPYAVILELQNDDEIKESKKKKEKTAGGFLSDLPDNENDFIAYLSQNVGSCEDALVFFEKSRIIFGKLKWQTGFGGKKWSQIANTALMRLQGKIDAIVFIDTAFNIEHHGGHIFDKNPNVDCDGEELYEILDTKRDKDLECLYKLCRKHLFEWTKKYFKKGVEFGWWKEANTGGSNGKK